MQTLKWYSSKLWPWQWGNAVWDDLPSMACRCAYCMWVLHESAE